MTAAAGLAVPCYAMIRPRAGLFRFPDVEVEIMLAETATARAAGLAGVIAATRPHTKYPYLISK